MPDSAVAEPLSFKVPYLPKEGLSYTFENGHTLLFIYKPGKVFNVSTWVKTGSIHEDAQNNGVSHFLEHLMFKGTERFKPGEFDHAMEAMGAIINAATWKDFTFYYVTGPNTEPEVFDKVLDMHADMLLHSNLPDAELGPQYNPEDANYDGPKRERTVVIEEIGMREDQPWTKIYNSINNLMYPDAHPYKRDVIGTRQIVGQIPRSAIEAYYRRWYSPEQMSTIVVGDFDFETLKTKVAAAFNFASIKMPANVLADYVEPPATTAFNVSYKTDGERFEKIEGSYATHFFMMAFAGPAVTELKTSIALDVVSGVFGEGRSSRLNQNLIEKPEEPNFNMLGSSQSTFKLGNVFYIQGNFTSSDVEASLEEVRAELAALLGDKPITQDEFERMVHKMKVSFAEASETASGLADTLGDCLTVAGSLGHFSNYLSVLETVTLADVHQAAQTYLRPSSVYTSVLVPTTHA
jgi:zinc protease